MIDLDLFFRYLKERCYHNAMATNVVKKWQTHTFVALALRNRMGYRYFNVRINSANDACMLCENVMKFGPVNPELTELICERQVRHGQKPGVFRRISPDILDRFSQSFHHIKALYMQMMDLYLIFQFVKGLCHGNK